MNDLVRIVDKLTMSSREIAVICDKRHDNVMRDIKSMFFGLGVDDLSFEASYTNAQNKEQPCYNLPKDLTLTLVSGYNVKLRKRIIDRWMELESNNRPDPMAALNDPATMRGLLLTYSEKVLSLESRVAAQAPKVEALDRIATASDGSMCMTDAAKHLQFPPRKLIAYLAANSWIYRRVGNANWLAYQDILQRGLLEHKIVQVERDDGSTKVCESVLVTARGLAVLSEKITKMYGLS